MWPFKKLIQTQHLLPDGTLSVTPLSKPVIKPLYEEVKNTKSIDDVAVLEDILIEELSKETELKTNIMNKRMTEFEERRLALQEKRNTPVDMFDPELGYETDSEKIRQIALDSLKPGADLSVLEKIHPMMEYAGLYPHIMKLHDTVPDLPNLEQVKEDVHAVMEAVGSSLEGASVYGLQTEVMAFAFIALKEDPSLSIQQAIDIGFNEWVK